MTWTCSCYHAPEQHGADGCEARGMFNEPCSCAARRGVMANKEQKAPKQTKKKLTIQEKKAKKKEKQLRKAGG
jgi:hypothetical protein